MVLWCIYSDIFAYTLCKEWISVKVTKYGSLFQIKPQRSKPPPPPPKCKQVDLWERFIFFQGNWKSNWVGIIAQMLAFGWCGFKKATLRTTSNIFNFVTRYFLIRKEQGTKVAAKNTGLGDNLKGFLKFRVNVARTHFFRTPIGKLPHCAITSYFLYSCRIYYSSRNFLL